jgi:hypothetical protein
MPMPGTPVFDDPAMIAATTPIAHANGDMSDSCTAAKSTPPPAARLSVHE